MKNSVIIHSLTPEELSGIITETIKTELSIFKSQNKKTDDEKLLTRDDVCKLLQINPATLANWQNEGKIKVYGIGGRRYFKKSEIIELLIPLKK